MYLCHFHISYASSASFYPIINVTPLVGHRKQTKKISQSNKYEIFTTLLVRVKFKSVPAPHNEIQRSEGG